MVPLPLQASLPRKAMQMGNVPPTTLTAHRQPHKPGAPRGFPNVMPEISRPVHHSRGHSGSGWMGENPGWGGCSLIAQPSTRPASPSTAISLEPLWLVPWGKASWAELCTGVRAVFISLQDLGQALGEQPGASTRGKEKCHL